MSRVHLESGQMQGQCIEEYNKLKRKLKQNGCFVVISESEFIVGDAKYRVGWKEQFYIVNEPCPLGSFGSMDEAEAFAMGISAAKRKKWKP